MKQVLIILLLVVSKNGITQDDCACNIKNLVTVNQHLDALTMQDIQLLLCTFDEKCKNNSEFTAFSNEMLFETMQRKPELLLKELAQNKNEPNYKIILTELENPIHDGFDLQELVDKITAIKVDEQTKEQVLRSLNVAIDKSK